MISAALELGLGSYEGPEEAELTKHAGGRDKSHVKVTPDLWGTLCKTCTKDTVVTKNTGSGYPVINIFFPKYLNATNSVFCSRIL